MCGDCWNAAMGAPTAAVAARFAWVGYKDRIPFLNRRSDAATRRQAPGDHDTMCQAPRVVAADEAELVEAGAPPP